MAEKPNPVKFMIENESAILDAYQRADRSPKKTWEVLQGSMPEIEKIMSFNTFKQYITPFALVVDEVGSRLASVTQELHRSKKRGEKLENQLDQVTQELHSMRERRDVTQGLHSTTGTSNNIDGWTVHQGKDGYYRLHRRFDGKLYSIYAGKALDPDALKEKIRTKEAEIRGKIEAKKGA